MKIKAFLFDRDGVLIKNYGYVYKIEKIKWLKGVFKAINFLNKKKIKVFVVTNQSGIARGYFTINELNNFHKFFINELKKKDCKINEIFFCPHHSKGLIKKYRKKCRCRKPNNQMILNIMKKYNFKAENLFMIGDQETDYLCAKKSKIFFQYKKKISLDKQVKKIF